MQTHETHLRGITTHRAAQISGHVLLVEMRPPVRMHPCCLVALGQALTLGYTFEEGDVMECPNCGRAQAHP